MQQPPNPYPHYPEQQPSQTQPSQQQWQQQPNYTQNQSYFPPSPTSSQQQESRPPQLDKPPTSRTARNRTWLWVLIALFIGMVIGYAIHVPSAPSTSNNTTTQNTSQATSQPTQAPTRVPITPTPTHTLKWTTVQTFTGNGSKKTAIFTVPNDWKIVWSCNPSSFGGSYNVQLDVVNADGSTFDPGAINTICQSGNVSGETEEHQSGQVYFDITSEAAWTIQVQELK